MNHRDSKDEEKFGKFNRSTASMGNNRKKKNMQRLGGAGLSLEAFANAKSVSNKYNPAFKKKQREFYKNAKYVSKYKKSMKPQNQQNDTSLAMRPVEGQTPTRDVDEKNIKNKKKKKPSMEELYKKKREEEEQARIQKEAIIQAKKEEREKAEAERKATRAKMFKKTKYGQPVMKYRIEHLLQTIQSSSKNSGNSSN